MEKSMVHIETSGGGGIILMLQVIIAVIMIISLWKIFAKAGKPGWASIIPIYNAIVMMQIAGTPIWWILLMFIPIVNLVISIIVLIELAKRFGQGTGYAIGMLLLPIIFFPMLAFGSATYQDTVE